MESERRHELKSNELADWISNLPTWLEENKFNVAVSAIAVILVLVSFYLWSTRNKYSVSRQQYEFTSTAEQVLIGKLQAASPKTQTSGTDSIRSAAEKLQAISKQLPSDESEALALIKSAEASRAQAHFLQNPDAKAIAYQMDKAKKAYQLALEKGKKNLQITSLANFGLGITEEELGNFEQARGHYNKIAYDPNYTGTAGAPLAATRLATISDYKGSFVFIDVPQAPAQAAPAPEAPEAVVPAPSQNTPAK